MSNKDQPAGGPDEPVDSIATTPDEYIVGDIVACSLSNSPDMAVMQTWHEAITGELWCQCFWFTDDRKGAERAFPACLLRKVEG